MATRPGGTPVPIPNTAVKTRAADGTMLETAWESRWLPEPVPPQDPGPAGARKGLIAQPVRAHA